jgi:hypothetical protein
VNPRVIDFGGTAGRDQGRAHEFAAADVFAIVMADVTLYSIRCHRVSPNPD